MSILFIKFKSECQSCCYLCGRSNDSYKCSYDYYYCYYYCLCFSKKDNNIKEKESNESDNNDEQVDENVNFISLNNINGIIDKSSAIGNFANFNMTGDNIENISFIGNDNSKNSENVDNTSFNISLIKRSFINNIKHDNNNDKNESNNNNNINNNRRMTIKHMAMTMVLNKALRNASLTPSSGEKEEEEEMNDSRNVIFLSRRRRQMSSQRSSLNKKYSVLNSKMISSISDVNIDNCHSFAFNSLSHFNTSQISFTSSPQLVKSRSVYNYNISNNIIENSDDEPFENDSENNNKKYRIFDIEDNVIEDNCDIFNEINEIFKKSSCICGGYYFPYPLMQHLLYLQLNCSIDNPIIRHDDIILDSSLNSFPLLKCSSALLNHEGGDENNNHNNNQDFDNRLLLSLRQCELKESQQLQQLQLLFFSHLLSLHDVIIREYLFRHLYVLDQERAEFYKIKILHKTIKKKLSKKKIFYDKFDNFSLKNRDKINYEKNGDNNSLSIIAAKKSETVSATFDNNTGNQNNHINKARPSLLMNFSPEDSTQIVSGESNLNSTNDERNINRVSDKNNGNINITFEIERDFIADNLGKESGHVALTLEAFYFWDIVVNEFKKMVDENNKIDNSNIKNKTSKAASAQCLMKERDAISNNNFGFHSDYEEEEEEEHGDDDFYSLDPRNILAGSGDIPPGSPFWLLGEQHLIIKWHGRLFKHKQSMRLFQCNLAKTEQIRGQIQGLIRKQSQKRLKLDQMQIKRLRSSKNFRIFGIQGVGGNEEINIGINNNTNYFNSNNNNNSNIIVNRDNNVSGSNMNSFYDNISIANDNQQYSVEMVGKRSSKQVNIIDVNGDKSAGNDIKFNLIPRCLSKVSNYFTSGAHRDINKGKGTRGLSRIESKIDYYFYNSTSGQNQADKKKKEKSPKVDRKVHLFSPFSSYFLFKSSGKYFFNNNNNVRETGQSSISEPFNPLSFVKDDTSNKDFDNCIDFGNAIDVSNIPSRTNMSSVQQNVDKNDIKNKNCFNKNQQKYFQWNYLKAMLHAHQCDLENAFSLLIQQLYLEEEHRRYVLQQLYFYYVACARAEYENVVIITKEIRDNYIRDILKLDQSYKITKNVYSIKIEPNILDCDENKGNMFNNTLLLSLPSKKVLLPRVSSIVRDNNDINSDNIYYYINNVNLNNQLCGNYQLYKQHRLQRRRLLISIQQSLMSSLLLTQTQLLPLISTLVCSNANECISSLFFIYNNSERLLFSSTSSSFSTIKLLLNRTSSNFNNNNNEKFNKIIIKNILLDVERHLFHLKMTQKRKNGDFNDREDKKGNYIRAKEIENSEIYDINDNIIEKKVEDSRARRSLSTTTTVIPTSPIISFDTLSKTAAFPSETSSSPSSPPFVVQLMLLVHKYCVYHYRRYLYHSLVPLIVQCVSLRGAAVRECVIAYGQLLLAFIEEKDLVISNYNRKVRKMNRFFLLNRNLSPSLVSGKYSNNFSSNNNTQNGLQTKEKGKQRPTTSIYDSNDVTVKDTNNTTSLNNLTLNQSTSPTTTLEAHKVVDIEGDSNSNKYFSEGDNRGYLLSNLNSSSATTTVSISSSARSVVEAISAALANMSDESPYFFHPRYSDNYDEPNKTFEGMPNGDAALFSYHYQHQCSSSPSSSALLSMLLLLTKTPTSLPVIDESSQADMPLYPNVLFTVIKLGKGKGRQPTSSNFIVDNNATSYYNKNNIRNLNHNNLKNSEIITKEKKKVLKHASFFTFSYFSFSDPKILKEYRKKIKKTLYSIIFSSLNKNNKNKDDANVILLPRRKMAIKRFDFFDDDNKYLKLLLEESGISPSNSFFSSSLSANDIKKNNKMSKMSKIIKKSEKSKSSELLKIDKIASAKYFYSFMPSFSTSYSPYPYTNGCRRGCSPFENNIFINNNVTNGSRNSSTDLLFLSPVEEAIHVITSQRLKLLNSSEYDAYQFNVIDGLQFISPLLFTKDCGYLNGVEVVLRMELYNTEHRAAMGIAVCMADELNALIKLKTSDGAACDDGNNSDEEDNNVDTETDDSENEDNYEGAYKEIEKNQKEEKNNERDKNIDNRKRGENEGNRNDDKDGNVLDRYFYYDDFEDNSENNFYDRDIDFTSIIIEAKKYIPTSSPPLWMIIQSRLISSGIYYHNINNIYNKNNYELSIFSNVNSKNNDNSDMSKCLMKRLTNSLQHHFYHLDDFCSTFFNQVNKNNNTDNNYSSSNDNEINKYNFPSATSFPFTSKLISCLLPRFRIFKNYFNYSYYYYDKITNNSSNDVDIDEEKKKISKHNEGNKGNIVNNNNSTNNDNSDNNKKGSYNIDDKDSNNINFMIKYNKDTDKIKCDEIGVSYNICNNFFIKDTIGKEKVENFKDDILENTTFANNNIIKADNSINTNNYNKNIIEHENNFSLKPLLRLYTVADIKKNDVISKISYSCNNSNDIENNINNIKSNNNNIFDSRGVTAEFLPKMNTDNNNANEKKHKIRLSSFKPHELPTLF